MPFGQSTIVEQAVDNLLGSAVDEVIVVVGYKAEDVTKAIAAKSIKLVINPDYEQGMSTSIIAGLKLVSVRCCQPPRGEAVSLPYHLHHDSTGW